MGLVLVVLLFLLVFGLLPTWNYNRDRGNGPFATVTVLFIVLLVLVLMGKL